MIPFLTVGSGQIFAVGGNDLFIPVEAVLPAAGQRALAFVVLVHIDEAVPLLHLAGGSTDQVDGAPGGVAQQGQAVLVDGLFHLLNVGPQVVDAVGVVDGTICFHLVHRTQTVLHDEERFLVAVIQAVHGDAQAHRVDGPAPIAGLEVGVLDGIHDGIAAGLVHQFGVHSGAAAGIVAEGDEVHGVLPQQGVIAGCSGGIFDSIFDMFGGGSGGSW